MKAHWCSLPELPSLAGQQILDFLARTDDRQVVPFAEPVTVQVSFNCADLSDEPSNFIPAVMANGTAFFARRGGGQISKLYWVWQSVSGRWDLVWLPLSLSLESTNQSLIKLLDPQNDAELTHS